MLNKEDRTCLILDVAFPFDTRVNIKEKEKIEKYHDLKREITRIWKCKTVKVMHNRRVGYLPERFREMAWDDRDVKPIRDVAEVTFTGISKNFKESFRHLECYVKAPKATGSSLMPHLRH